MFTKRADAPILYFYSFNVELHEGQASENRPNIRVRYKHKSNEVKNINFLRYFGCRR